MAFSFLYRNKVFEQNNVELRPILLGGLFKLMNKEVDPNQHMPPVKRDYIKTDIKRQADYFNVPLNFHERHPLSSLKAMRLIIQSPSHLRAQLSARLYQAYWQENLDIDEDELIIKIAQEFSLPFPDEEAKIKLKESTQEAYEKKIFGVPSFIVDGKIYFGADRIHLFQERLGLTLPDCPWKKNSQPINFYFDFASPYSYLAFKELAHSGVNFKAIPVLLGALFKNYEVSSIPMLSAHPNKIAYYYQDMSDWARFRGAQFVFNDYFPLRSVTANRIALLKPECIDAIFKAAWADNKNITDEAILISVLSQSGFDGENLVKRSSQDEIKALLRKNTNDAIAKGVFGVPSFEINGNLVFGQDRFSWIRLQNEILNP